MHPTNWALRIAPMYHLVAILADGATAVAPAACYFVNTIACVRL